jgi:copper homeostasis protein
LALSNGADLIELCSALAVGGLTPSHGFMQAAAAAAAAAPGIPIVAMIRPRAGDFVYTREELEVMKADIRAARAAGLAGVVLGASCPNGSLDVSALAALVEEARAPVGQGVEVRIDRCVTGWGGKGVAFL